MAARMLNGIMLVHKCKALRIKFFGDVLNARNVESCFTFHYQPLICVYYLCVLYAHVIINYIIGFTQNTSISRICICLTCTSDEAHRKLGYIEVHDQIYWFLQYLKENNSRIGYLLLMFPPSSSCMNIVEKFHHNAGLSWHLSSSSICSTAILEVFIILKENEPSQFIN